MGEGFGCLVEVEDFVDDGVEAGFCDRGVHLLEHGARTDVDALHAKLFVEDGSKGDWV